MRYLDEYRDAAKVRLMADEIARSTTRTWSIMEVCGGQTHSILKHGLDQLLPSEIELLHGPGCPVCVTAVATIDHAIHIAHQPGTVLCTYGDMLRVPGTSTDLMTAKSLGADVRILYSPLEALRLAETLPDRQIVLLAIGFETTAPAHAMAIHAARKRGLVNFSALVAHVLVPPAMESILRDPEHRVDAFLAAGHVCSITGYRDYHRIAREHRTPIVITGFEPLDLLDGIRRAIQQLERGDSRVENAYARVVTESGNTTAQSLLSEVFECTDREWRGMGGIASSGWQLTPAYRELDASRRFPFRRGLPQTSPADRCRAGDVLCGRIKPTQCDAFGTQCTPDTPIGAPMVSHEGACAAYFWYRNLEHAPNNLADQPPDRPNSL
jgi:hydrogenase expression/formation protein HypD